MKLTFKNFNYGIVIAIILCLLFWLWLLGGCVTWTKNIEVHIVNPNVTIEAEVK